VGDEGVCFAAYAQHYCPSGRLLSDYSEFESMEVGMTPRVVDESLRKEMKQVGGAWGWGWGLGVWDGGGWGAWTEVLKREAF